MRKAVGMQTVMEQIQHPNGEKEIEYSQSKERGLIRLKAFHFTLSNKSSYMGRVTTHMGR